MYKEQLMPFADFSCPARDEINPVRENYDPADVDWNAVVADIEKVCSVQLTTQILYTQLCCFSRELDSQCMS